MSKKLLLILGAIFLLLLVITVATQGKLGNRNATKVVVEEAALKDIVETVTANGKIYPFKEVKLSLELPGEITGIYVEEGDSVQEGDLLLTINADNYISNVAQTKATYNQSLANLANANARSIQAESQFQIIKNDYYRKKDLFNQNVIALSEFEAVESQYLAALGEKDAAQKTVEANQYQVESAKAVLQQAQDNLGRTKLYAPMSGIVSKLNVELGERVVGTAQMAGTELVTISDFEKMELVVEVGENEVLRVKNGDTALIEIDAYLEDEIKGVVKHVAYASNALLEEQVTKFDVEIILDPKSYAHLITPNNLFPFRPGMSASTEIVTQKKAAILCVPIQSVTLRDLTPEDDFDEKSQVVFVVVDGIVQIREVKTGIQDDTSIEVLSGVNKGEKVVSAPFKAISKDLKKNDQVSIITEEELYED